MQIRPFEKKDHYTVCKWWKQHDWQGLSLNMLPPTGYIVDDVCAGWLYKTDGGWALLEWIISNPESDKDKRDEALDRLISKLIEEADNAGVKAIFTSSNHPKLVERYGKHNFKITDTNVTHMVRTK